MTRAINSVLLFGCKRISVAAFYRSDCGFLCLVVIEQGFFVWGRAEYPENERSACE